MLQQLRRIALIIGDAKQDRTTGAPFPQIPPVDADTDAEQSRRETSDDDPTATHSLPERTDAMSQQERQTIYATAIQQLKAERDKPAPLPLIKP